jgi:hypothetical protein
MAVFNAVPASHAWICLGVVIVGLSGCGSDIKLVPVEGKVTLDGSPLAGAEVLFRPKQGRPVAGDTDAAGRYRLQYTPERFGALPGPHVVHITTVREGDEDAASKPPRERVPARYNARTELEVTVADDRKSYDFALESK